jgi:cytochrome c oxidase assembly protein subunit 15
MGCPDWPSCYGLIIPPTSADQLPAKYQELYANDGIPADPFDATKTWIEYINRLLGALLGISVLVQAGLSLSSLLGFTAIIVSHRFSGMAWCSCSFIESGTLSHNNSYDGRISDSDDR